MITRQKKQYHNVNFHVLNTEELYYKKKNKARSIFFLIRKKN